MQRFGEMIKIRPEKYNEYIELHKNIPPTIVKKIYAANITNFTIFYRDGYLFKYFEYIGDNYESDMEMLSNDKENIAWLASTDPCQLRDETAMDGEWWIPLKKIFHI